MSLRIYLTSALVLSLAIVLSGAAVRRPQAIQSNAGLLNYDKPISALLNTRRFDRTQIQLRVEKTRFVLTVDYRGRPLKSYPIVLGTDPVNPKLREDDGCTPEGDFKIVEIRSPHKWGKFMLLSYPTAESHRRFEEAKAASKLPLHATIGGAIGIHGVPKGCDSAIDAHQNWTLGCISLKTADIAEVYSICRRGTPVHILH